MKRPIGNALIIVGAVFLFGAATLFIHNLNADANAANAAHNVLTILTTEIEKREKQTVEPPRTEDEVIERRREESIEQTVTVDGSDYIGYLDIPDLEITLPVMSKWSYEGLTAAPCRYSGTAAENNLVICAHNYTSHFGRLSELKTGDKIYFIDVNGTVREYAVAEPEELAPSKTDYMTSSDYELTLFTCTYTGAARYTVRCTENEAD